MAFPSNPSDGQIYIASGPNNTSVVYEFDAETMTWTRQSYAVTLLHGTSHITSDPIPDASANNDGIMTKEDKVRLDELDQTRIGVLGFMGSGQPDDGGWLTGDVILAAGTDFISIERFGNVIRFTVDAPMALSYPEECATLYWIQDETDISAIRPPVVSGIQPDANVYGELKCYLLPEDYVITDDFSTAVISYKLSQPALVFKRYENDTTPGQAQFEVILKRNANNSSYVGWSFTPGEPGEVESVWWVGADDDGNQLRFDLKPETTANLLGALTYNGHTITKRPAIITDVVAYSSTLNQYTVKYWDIDNEETIGDAFVATNVWQYTLGNDNVNVKVADGTRQTLEIGVIVDLHEFKVGTTTYRRYFSKEPRPDEGEVWVELDNISFGDELEEQVYTGSYDIIDDYADHQITGNWRVLPYGRQIYPHSTTEIETMHMAFAKTDSSIPGLVIDDDYLYNSDSSMPTLPTMLWYNHGLTSVYTKILVGRPNASDYPPIDILYRATIDEYIRSTNSYAIEYMAYRTGASLDYALDGTGLAPCFVQNSSTLSILQFGSINRGYLAVIEEFTNRIIHVGKFTNVYRTTTSVILPLSAHITGLNDATAYRVMILPEQFTNPILRLEFGINDESGAEAMQLQFKHGTLAMDEPYSLNEEGTYDNYIKGITDLSVSKIYTQMGFAANEEEMEDIVTELPIYDGGYTTDTNNVEMEVWNELELILYSDKLYVYWNGTLIPPDAAASAALDIPMAVGQEYFTVSTAYQSSAGKFGIRMWPGAVIKSVQIHASSKERL